MDSPRALSLVTRQLTEARLYFHRSPRPDQGSGRITDPRPTTVTSQRGVAQRPGSICLGRRNWAATRWSRIDRMPTARSVHCWHGRRSCELSRGWVTSSRQHRSACPRRSCLTRWERHRHSSNALRFGATHDEAVLLAPTAAHPRPRTGRRPLCLPVADRSGHHTGVRLGDSPQLRTRLGGQSLRPEGRWSGDVVHAALDFRRRRAYRFYIL